MTRLKKNWLPATSRCMHSDRSFLQAPHIRSLAGRILILLAYWGAYAVKFGALSGRGVKLFFRTCRYCVCKDGFVLVVGVYRGLWRYTGLGRFIVFAKAVVLEFSAQRVAVLSLPSKIFAHCFMSYGSLFHVSAGEPPALR